MGWSTVMAENDLKQFWMDFLETGLPQFGWKGFYLTPLELEATVHGTIAEFMLVRKYFFGGAKTTCPA